MGGFTEGRALQQDEVTIIQNQKQAVEQRVNKTYSKFEPKSVKSQVVAGINYMFKVEVDNGEFIHVKVYKPLPHTGQPPEVSEVTEGQTADSDL